MNNDEVRKKQYDWKITDVGDPKDFIPVDAIDNVTKPTEAFLYHNPGIAWQLLLFLHAKFLDDAVFAVCQHIDRNAPIPADVVDGFKIYSLRGEKAVRDHFFTTPV